MRAPVAVGILGWASSLRKCKILRLGTKKKKNLNFQTAQHWTQEQSVTQWSRCGSLKATWNSGLNAERAHNKKLPLFSPTSKTVKAPWQGNSGVPSLKWWDINKENYMKLQKEKSGSVSFCSYFIPWTSSVPIVVLTVLRFFHQPGKSQVLHFRFKAVRAANIWKVKLHNYLAVQASSPYRNTQIMNTFPLKNLCFKKIINKTFQLWTLLAQGGF